ncbi:hypothetical protein [Sulfitobacter sp.]|uniref:hypothetical protein n=1 Tax=Sulfitobacter sp. TaxID=1903071 RepID=UPI003EF495F0
MSDTRTPVMRTKHTVNTTQHMHLGLLTHPNNDIVPVILTRDTKPVVAQRIYNPQLTAFHDRKTAIIPFLDFFHKPA